MAILPDRSDLPTPADGDLYMTTDVSDTTDAATGTDKKITWANIKAALKTYFDTLYQPLTAVLTATTASFLTAMETKINFISVTQAVDLDQMETDIAALANGMVYKGNWDASAGTFPGAGAAQTGWFYTVSVGGTVDSVVFNVGDRLIATVDNASTSTYASNWTQLDATDAVTSVDSATGNVDLGTILNAKTAKTTPINADSFSITDSAASNVLKKLTFTNLKAFLKTYFDTLYATAANTITFTNKRTTKRTGSTTSSATPTINTDNYDVYRLTAQTVAITSFTTNLSGTPNHNDNLIIEVTGTAARAITWGTSFESSTVTLPTTTVTTAMLKVGLQWNAATSKWRCVAVA